MIEQLIFGQIAEQIDHYYRLQQEIKRLEMSLAIAHDLILEAFKTTGMRYLVTPSKLVARVDTSYRKTISYKEAEALLDPDTLTKLTRESTSITLRVMPKKEEENVQELP